MLPEELVKWYAGHGYQFLGLSEHNTVADREVWIAESEIKRRIGDAKPCWRAADCKPRTRLVEGVEQWRLAPFSELRERFAQQGRFLLLENEEITSDLGAKRVHVNAVNISEVIDAAVGDDAATVLAEDLGRLETSGQHQREPALGIVNHPNFTWALTPADLGRMKAARFVEIFNGHPFAASRGDMGKRSAVRIWDVANAERVLQRRWQPLYGVASDDTHALEGATEASPGRGWIVVRAAELRAVDLIEAMLNGQFYASTGVNLRECEYDALKRKLVVVVAPATGAAYQVDFIVTKLGAKPMDDGAPGDRWDVPSVGMLAKRVIGTRAEYDLAPDDAYVRATISASSRPVNPMQSNYTGDEAQFEQAFTQPVGWR
jgi:hypothetical protein